MNSVRGLMRRKAYRTFFISFIAMFLVPVLALAGVVTRFSYNLEQEAAMSSRLVLEQLKSGVDGRLYTVMRMADSMVVDDKALYFAERDDPMRLLNNISSFQMLKGLTQDVGIMSSVYADVEQCYLYFPRSGKIISNTISDAGAFFERKLTGAFGGFDAWLAFLAERPDGFLRLSQVHYLRTLRRGGTHLISVVITLGGAAFDAYRALFAEGSQIQALIFSAEGEPLFATGEEMDLTPKMHTMADGMQSVSIDGESYRAYWTRSQETGCLYLTMTPEAVYSHSLRALQIGSVAGGMLLLAAGLLLSRWLALRQYRPILALRRFIDDKSGGADADDDFGYLSEILRAINEENRAITEQARASGEKLRHFTIERLLKGMYASPAQMEEQLLALNITLDAKAFAVAGMRIDGFAGNIREPLLEDRLLMRFVVLNVFEELLACFGACAAICDGTIWVVYCVEDEGDDWQSALEGKLMDGRRFLRDRFDFSLTVVASDKAAGLDGVHRAYRDALRLLRQSEGGQDGLLLAWRLSAAPLVDATSGTPTADGQRLAQAMITGDEAAAFALIKAFAKQAGALPYHLARLRWSALLQAALPLLTGYDDQALRAIDERVRIFTEASPLHDDAEAVRALCQYVCRLPQRADAGKGADIAPRVRAYIERSYAQSGLNIAQIADYLGITASYASSLYKRQAGESMLDTINRTRLLKAKALLLETALGHEEIAERVGYFNSSTFLRAFKKYEGLTPGQFRAMRAKREEA